MRLVVAGTGHRPNKLRGGYSEETFERLVELAQSALVRHEATHVISGMALGWDQALAEATRRLGLPLVAYIPFAGQEGRWPIESQQRWQSLCDYASAKVVVCEGGYTPQKMQHRNERMVNDCDMLLALWNGDTSGGTWNCVKYAQTQTRVQIVNLWPRWNQ